MKRWLRRWGVALMICALTVRAKLARALARLLMR
jgi:hypothetical protein